VIYWRIQDLYDANICEQGRVDCEAYMAQTGKTATDWLTAVEGLFGGVAGSVWGLGFTKKSHELKARDALSRFIVKTGERYGKEAFLPAHTLTKLDLLLQGATINLTPMREKLRALSVGESYRPYIRAVALLFYVALDERTMLNVRAVRVSEQAMLAATYHEGHAVPSTEAYKAEYQRQYDDLKVILEGTK
jgi:hypothetical protein